MASVDPFTELARLKAMGPVLCLSVSTTGTLLAAAGESKVVELWSMTEPAPKHSGTLVVDLLSAKAGLSKGSKRALLLASAFLLLPLSSPPLAPPASFPCSDGHTLHDHPPLYTGAKIR